MKKFLFFLMGIALLGVSCQQDENIHNATNGDMVEVNIGVGVPELATRSGETDMNSGLGAIDNFSADEWEKYDIRYMLEIYDVTDVYADLEAPIKKREIKTYDEYQETMFTVRLVPNRDYRFVLWADFVNQGSEDDLYYNTTDLNSITRIVNAVAMDECQDAYFIQKDLKVGNSGIEESLVLKRPFGKIRVITTDYDEVNIGSEPAKVEVKFHTHKLLTTLNAVTGVAEGETVNEYTYTVDKNAPYTKGYDELDQNMTLFADYILAADETVGAQEVNFTIEVTGRDGRVINSHDFNTQIPLERNHLTTIVGNLLTLQNDINISIDDNFDGEYIRNWDEEAVTIENGNWGYGELNANGNYEFDITSGANSFTLIVPKDAVNQTTGKLNPVGKAEFVASESDLVKNTFTITKFMVDATRAAELATVTSGTLRISNWNDGIHAQFDLYYTFDDEVFNNIRFEFKGEALAMTALATPEVDASVVKNVITLSWAPIDGAGSYAITNGTEMPVFVDECEYTFTGEFDTEYTFSVVAVPADEAKNYPSEADAISVRTESEVTELTIVNHGFGYAASMETEVIFMEATPEVKHIIDFRMTGIEAGSYTDTDGGIILGYSLYMAGSSDYDGGVILSSANATIVDNGDTTFTFDVTFVAEGNTYHFTYTTPAEEVEESGNVVELVSKSAGEQIGSYAYGCLLSDAEGNNQVKIAVDQYYSWDSATDFPKANDYTTWQSSPSYIMTGSHFSFVNKTLKVNGVTYANDAISNAKLTVVEATSITVEFTVDGEDYKFVYTESGDEGGNGGNGGGTTPSEPTKLATPSVSGSVSGNAATVSWQEIAGAKDYTVTLNGTIVNTVEDAYIVYSDLDYSTTYSVSVVANPADSAVNSASDAGTATFTTEADPNAGGNTQSFENWVFDASLNMGAKIIKVTDGSHTVEFTINQVSGGTFHIFDNGALNITKVVVNGVETTDASGTVVMNASNNYHIDLNCTINGVKYTGRSNNAVV